MKHNIYSLILILLAAQLCGCSDWLEVDPGDTQLAEQYWTSKAAVDNMVMGGYSYLRNTVEDQLIPYGEQRAGLVYLRSNPKMQQLDIQSTNSVADWSNFYKIINVANVVLENAHKVQEQDLTYTDSQLASHRTEAYFLRAIAYFYLVRNWRDVPLVTEAVEDDTKPFLYAKSDEATVIAQIKSDIKAALESGAAKEEFETTWETKSRATKWSLNALMADVCLWSGDYQGCIDYCNGVLESRSTKAPKLLTDPSRSTWYSMFNPGNSKESIYEIQWNYEEDQTNNLYTLFGPGGSESADNYRVSPKLTADFGLDYEQYLNLKDNGQGSAEGDESASGDAVRSLWSSVYTRGGGISSATTSTWSYIYKYSGVLMGHSMRGTDARDANFIIYRVADLVLMKAEALILLGGIDDGTRALADDDDDDSGAGQGGSDDEVITNQNWYEAVQLINQIRTRAAVEPRSYSATYSQQDYLQMVLEERFLEFAGEGKIWYDLLRMGRLSSKYRQQLLIQNVIDYSTNGTNVKESTIKNILGDDGLCFLPVYSTELERDSLLVQNPSYKQ